MLLKAFDHGAAELFRYPDALRHPRINVRNLWIAYTWIIVTGVDERNILRDRIKQVLRELGYRWERDRYNNDAGGLDSSARVSTAVAPISSAKSPDRHPGLWNSRRGHRVRRRSTCGQRCRRCCGFR
jgi:hypothetical protein